MLRNRVSLKNANVNDMSNDLEETTRNSSMRWAEWRLLFGEKIRILSNKKVRFLRSWVGPDLKIYALDLPDQQRTWRMIGQDVQKQKYA